MQVLFLDAPYNGKVELCKQTTDYLIKKKYKTVALYASVQFCNQLDVVEKQLKNLNINVVTSQPDRTHVNKQLLGCDVYRTSLKLSGKQIKEIDCYLYVGDGRFHPYALAYLQKDVENKKEIVCNDPIAEKCTIMSTQNIDTVLWKYKQSLKRFLLAKKVGVIITVKPGQQQLKPSKVIESTFPNKKFFYFIDDVVSFDQLENFPFIDVWVNTACPRVGFDDQEKFVKGVVNINDASNAENILDKMNAKKL